MSVEREPSPHEGATRMDRLDFISSIVLVLFGIGIAVESLRLPRLEKLNVNPFTVPGIVPGFLGVLITLCGGFVLVRSILRGAYKPLPKGNQNTDTTRSRAFKRSLVTFTLTITYALVLFPLVPFAIATPLFVFAFITTAETMALGHLPAWKKMLTGLVVAILAGIVIGYVFQELFFVRLPGG